MFLRSILFPSLIVSAIGMPMIITDSWNEPRSDQPSYDRFENQPPSWSTPGVAATASGYTRVASAPSNAYSPHMIPNRPSGLQPSIDSVQMLNADLSQVPAYPLTNETGFENQPLLPGMTPDFGAAETFVFPGNAAGPDLSATPLDFVPVMDFREIIRFDVFPNWVKSRWKRVSTTPGDAGLHGFRVACVTGTNSWDLHGSLTYYFDANQRAQRITFQGWTGDSTRLVNLLTSQYGLQAWPTHWAGCYASTENDRRRGQPVSGLLMKHPAIISTDNPVQQVALMMELNRPDGPFRMSQSFQERVQFALQTN